MNETTYQSAVSAYDRFTPDYDYDREIEWEFRLYKVTCSVCLITVTATEKALEADGWKLTAHGEYCGRCR